MNGSTWNGERGTVTIRHLIRTAKLLWAERRGTMAIHWSINRAVNAAPRFCHCAKAQAPKSLDPTHVKVPRFLQSFSVCRIPQRNLLLHTTPFSPRHETKELRTGRKFYCASEIRQTRISLVHPDLEVLSFPPLSHLLPPRSRASRPSNNTINFRRRAN